MPLLREAGPDVGGERTAYVEGGVSRAISAQTRPRPHAAPDRSPNAGPDRCPHYPAAAQDAKERDTGPPQCREGRQRGRSRVGNAKSKTPFANPPFRI